MAERDQVLEQRERQKNHQLEYAYAAPDVIAPYPILGSLIRALGRGWRVLVVAPLLQHSEFEALRQKLQNPDQLQITSVDQLETNNVSVRTGAVELVLSLYDDSERNLAIRNNLQILGRSHVMTVERQPDKTYDLISEFTQTKLHKRGVLAITGGGKGKTTTALGMAVEALYLGGKVAVVQWFKEVKSGAMTWAINEHNFPALLKEPDKFAFYPTGAGFVGSPNLDRVADTAEHVRKAKAGVALAQQLITSGEYTTVVLDEFVDTLKTVMPHLPSSLLDLAEVQAVLAVAKNSPTQVIVTGRQVTPEWAKYIGTSIEISEKKHPWSTRNASAEPGLDF